MTGSSVANTEKYRTDGFQGAIDGKGSREKNQIEENTVSKGGEEGWNGQTGLGGEMGIVGNGWERGLKADFVKFHKSLSL